MKAARAASIGGAAGLGLGLLALSAFHFSTTSNCASGPVPYAISTPCPHNSSAWFFVLIGGIVLAVTARALMGGEFLTSLLLLAVGGGCLVALATGSSSSSWKVTDIALGLIFGALGSWGLWTNKPAVVGSVVTVALPAAVVGLAVAVVAAAAVPGPLKEPKRSAASAAPVTASSSSSYYLAANLRSGLDAVSTALGQSARISSITIRPEVAVIDAISGGKIHSFSLSPGAAPQDFQSAASGDEKTVALSAIDAQAPVRLLAEVKSHFGIAATKIVHIDFSLGVVDGKPQWAGYLADGTYYAGNAHGTGVQKSG